MTRRHVATSVVVLWVAGLAWLAGREVARGGGSTTGDTILAINPTAAYHAILVDSVQVGVRSWSIDTTVNELIAQSFEFIDTPGDDGLERTNVRVVATMTRALDLKSFQTDVTGDIESWTARGVLEADSSLSVTLVINDDSTSTRFRVPSPVTLSTLLPITAMFRHAPAEGDTLDFDVVDPLLLTHRRTRVAVGPDSTFIFPDSAAFDSASNVWVAARLDTIQTTRFDLVDGGLTSRLWVQPSGLIAAMELGSGTVSRREAFELAYENFRRSPTPAVQSPFARAGLIFPRMSGNRRPTTTPGIVLRGIDATGYRDLGGVSVILRGDTAFLRGATADSGGRVRPGPRVRESLMAEPFMQIHDPRVGAVARQITSGVRDRSTWPNLIAQWLRDNVRREPSATALSAVHVLDARQADGISLVTTFVALARAVDIPARMASGLVVRADGVYVESWAEVFGGGWRRIAVRSNAAPADLYLRLAIGRTTRPWHIAELVGALQPEVL